MLNKLICRISCAIVFGACIYMYTHGYHHWIVIFGGCISAFQLVEN